MAFDRSWPRALGCAALLCSSLQSQTTTLASSDSSGNPGDATSRYPSISADGRWVAFESLATNLVPGDANGTWDVFVRDLQSGSTVRVSVDSAGLEGNGDSHAPSISADGRFVAFYSLASNLVAGDTNGFYDVFVHDLQSGSTARVSVDSSGAEGNGPSDISSISGDGILVAFKSLASNLVAGDTNGVFDVFVHDVQSGTTTRVSISSAGAQGNGPSLDPALSLDGQQVVFGSAASNLVAGDTNAKYDVFVRDLLGGTTQRVSVASSGAQGNNDSGNFTRPSISSTGRFVAFESLAGNLVSGDTNGSLDVFVRDRASGSTIRASVSSAGAQGNNHSGVPSISSDGRFVSFGSYATNMIAGDTNGVPDIFVRDLQAGSTVRVSVDSGGVEANGGSGVSAFGGGDSIAADGRSVAFYSVASNLVPGDTNSSADVFVHDSGSAWAFTPFCPGDGGVAACPCGNSGATGHGCENSNATGGALLSASGVASLSADSVQLTSSGECASAPSIVLQGSSVIAPAVFGDGLRCADGILLRLYVKTAVGGVVSAPLAGDPTISARSAALGDVIALGATRDYQIVYRDPSTSFCPAPTGSTFNVSSALAIVWGP